MNGAIAFGPAMAGTSERPRADQVTGLGPGQRGDKAARAGK